MVLRRIPVKELLDLTGVPNDDDNLGQDLDAGWCRAKTDPDPEYRARTHAGTMGLSVDGERKEKPLPETEATGRGAVSGSSTS